MKPPAALRAIRLLIRDTFRQARASGIHWLMLAISTVSVLACLSVDIQSVRNGTNGCVLTLGFGLHPVYLAVDAHEGVRFLELLLAGGVADTAGVLLILIWTAGFLPSFLEPTSAAVLLAKPEPRWSLLLGKYAGVLVFVVFQAMVFVGGTWIALGVRTGVWDTAYWLTVPMLLLHFAVFFGVSTFLAVSTRSTIACVFGSLAFWLMCWGMNYGRHAVVALPESDVMPASFHAAVEAGYWVLPKPADMGLLLFDALPVDSSLWKPTDLQIMQKKGAYYPGLSLVSSLAFGALMVGLSIFEFGTTDY